MCWGCSEREDGWMSFEWPRAADRLWRPRHRPGDLAAAEFRRLGRPGAYRLGRLRVQGVPGRRQPVPFRARFARRRDHRWPVFIWLLTLLASVVVIAVA